MIKYTAILLWFRIMSKARFDNAAGRKQKPGTTNVYCWNVDLIWTIHSSTGKTYEGNVLIGLSSAFINSMGKSLLWNDFRRLNWEVHLQKDINDHTGTSVRRNKIAWDCFLSSCAVIMALHSILSFFFFFQQFFLFYDSSLSMFLHLLTQTFQIGYFLLFLLSLAFRVPCEC